MPIQNTTYRIKDFTSITQEAQLVDKILEVESGTADENFKVSIPTLVQTVANNLPGANDSKSGYKMVRCLDTTTEQYRPGDSTLVGLNPAFLCLGTICKAEFPGVEYVLVYSANGPLTVWLDGTFAGQTIGAKWVEKNSLEEAVKGIEDFSPFVASYAEGDTVKYVLDGVLKLFVARKELVKTDFFRNLIPAPTGLATDENWREINPAGQTKIRDWRLGSYKKDEVVIWNQQLLRAKHDIAESFSTIAQDEVPAPDDWEVIAGDDTITEPYFYDDTQVKADIAAIKVEVGEVRDDLSSLGVNLNARIDDIVATATEWQTGSYQKGQLVLSSGLLFSAKQNIQNSTVAPTSTNAYWLQVSGSGAGYDDTLVMERLPSQNEKNALRGTSGTPSDINRFVTATDPKLNDARRVIIARNQNGVFYTGTDNDLTAAGSFVGQHGYISIQQVYDMRQDFTLQRGTLLDGNLRFFRILDYTLLMTDQSVIRNLKPEYIYPQNFGRIKSTSGTDSVSTPRIEFSELRVPVEVTAGAFIRLRNCLINANNWNLGAGTIYLENCIEFGAAGTGTGFATIVRSGSSNTDFATTTYVNAQNAIQNARIDDLEANGGSGGGSASVTGAALDAVINDVDGAIKANLDGSGNVLLYFNDNSIQNWHLVDDAISESKFTQELRDKINSGGSGGSTHSAPYLVGQDETERRLIVAPPSNYRYSEVECSLDINSIVPTVVTSTMVQGNHLVLEAGNFNRAAGSVGFRTRMGGGKAASAWITNPFAFMKSSTSDRPTNGLRFNTPESEAAGLSQYFQVPFAGSANGFTVAYWMKKNVAWNPNRYQWMFTTRNRWELYMTHTELSSVPYYLNGQPSTQMFRLTLIPGEWNRIVIMNTESQGPVGACDMTFFGTFFGSEVMEDASIRDVMIYNRRWTPEELATADAAPENGLIGRYDMTPNTTGGVLPDISGSGIDGILYGF